MSHETIHEAGCQALLAWDIPGACTCHPVRVTVCGGSATELSPESRAELRDFGAWLCLPKPRPLFHVWRKSVGGAPTQEGE